MNKPDVIEKFLKYVKVDTQSDPDSGTSPSTMKQHDLASLLALEVVNNVLVVVAILHSAEQLKPHKDHVLFVPRLF